MSNVWERFDGIVNAEEVLDAKAQFTPVPAGEYKAVLEEIAPSESKNGLPMVKGKFRMVEGNKILFYNQMLQNISYPNMTAVNIAEATTFIGALLDTDLEFTTLSDLANTISTIPIGGEYNVNVSYGKNDFDMKFPKLKIVEKSTLDVSEGITDGIEEELPFN